MRPKVAYGLVSERFLRLIVQDPLVLPRWGLCWNGLPGLHPKRCLSIPANFCISREN